MASEDRAEDVERRPAPRLTSEGKQPRTIQSTLDNFATTLDSGAFGAPKTLQDVSRDNARATTDTDDDHSTLDSGAELTEDFVAMQGHGSTSPTAQQESAAVMASAVVSPAVGTVPVETAHVEASTVSDPIAIAHQNGRNAALAGLPRILPDGFHYKSRRAEKDAWCQGYDEAARPAAEDFSDELHQAGAGFGV